MDRVLPQLIALTFTLLASTTAAAEGPGTAAEELAKLNRSVQELVAVVRQQLAGQKIELLMRQVEIKRAKVAPIEQALRAARETKENAEEQLRTSKYSLEQMLGNMADGFGSRQSGESPTPEEREEMEKAVEQLTRQHEFEVKLVRDRLAATEERIQQLENDLAPAKAELEHWEAMVDRELQGR